MSFLSLIQPYRRWILLVLACIFLTNILALCVPWGIKVIIDDVLRSRDLPLLRTTLWLLLAVLLIRTVLNFFHKYASSILGERIMGGLRQRLYSHAQRLALSSLQLVTPSQILARITGDVDSIRRFIFGDALDFVYSVFGAVGIVALLCWLNPRLAVIALGTLPFFAL
ncbi:MAG: ABC transporter ATP-binding protein, partial [Candidatus Omnitrophica bacterium]|nr:ABC transporter ATP-binding protein [Candidatus Omnitrophota bacterium]